MNHFQLLALTASFDLEWPAELRNFFSEAMPISQVSTQFLSVDCFLDTREKRSIIIDKENAESNQIQRVFFQKLIILAFSPILIFAACFLVWQVIFKVQQWLA